MPSSTTFTTTTAILDLFKRVADGDVHYHLAIADWLDGSFDVMGFDRLPADQPLPVTLVCNLARGRTSRPELQKLIDRGARVSTSEELLGAAWALTYPDIETGVGHSIEFTHCGTISQDYVSASTMVRDMVVSFQDPTAHREILLFIDLHARTYGRRLTSVDLV